MYFKPLVYINHYINIKLNITNKNYYLVQQKSYSEKKVIFKNLNNILHIHVY